jgi:structural maintenance of chromosome 4
VQVSELIHKSAEYPDLDYSRVSVYFHEIIDTGADEDAYTVVPDSQFVVTRTAHRNNSSKYYIDKALSNFTEVTTLLKGRGIDLDNNRFLILQGEVEQISMMKPKAAAAGEEGLLEYLEDIIGSNVYVTKIAEAEKVVETLSTERSEKLNRVKAAEKEVSALESSKTEAESLLRTYNDGNRVRKLHVTVVKPVQFMQARSATCSDSSPCCAKKLSSIQPLP